MVLKTTSPSKTPLWSTLSTHYKEISKISLKELFDSDAQRAQKYSISWGDFFLDFSKNHINDTTLEFLFKLAQESSLKESIEKMFNGDLINATEKRAVLHTALRHPINEPIYLSGEDIMPKVGNVLKKIKKFTKDILEGTHKGYSQKPICDVVNIGIGGSHLGPLMVSEALKHYKTHITTHFISNIDGSDLYETLKNLNPETTLFIIASKTFTTQETMQNAKSARRWFLEKGAQTEDISKHFVAISTNQAKVKEFGISSDCQFEFWDWVGGRYSLWGAIGLSISLAIGYENFDQLLKGAREMDLHFRSAPMQENLPIILALIGIWYTNFFGTTTHAIFPYEQYLKYFPSYLQQLEMESNGKYIDREGNKIKDYKTSPIIWGEVGTNGQHSFYQLLHQGTSFVPCDFIAFRDSLHPFKDHHQILLSHFFAQSKALAFGKSNKEIIQQLRAQGKGKEDIDALLPFKYFEGNRPSTSIFIKQLTPKNLGSLIALYEHKVFVQGIIWNIFSFDQWGVELGKELSSSILEELIKGKDTTIFDSSTNQLIYQYNKMGK